MTKNTLSILLSLTAIALSGSVFADDSAQLDRNKNVLMGNAAVGIAGLGTSFKLESKYRDLDDRLNSPYQQSARRLIVPGQEHGATNSINEDFKTLSARLNARSVHIGETVEIAYVKNGETSTFLWDGKSFRNLRKELNERGVNKIHSATILPSESLVFKRNAVRAAGYLGQGAAAVSGIVAIVGVPWMIQGDPKQSQKVAKAEKTETPSASEPSAAPANSAEPAQLL